MDGYSTKNFHNETQMKMTKIVEGDVIPTRFVEVLIVNPPKVSLCPYIIVPPLTLLLLSHESFTLKVFKRLWKVVKPCFSSTYKKRIHIIKNEELGNYLMDGYQDYLPDEFMGWRITEEMVTDWVDQKRYNDQQSCMFYTGEIFSGNRAETLAEAHHFVWPTIRFPPAFPPDSQTSTFSQIDARSPGVGPI